MNKTTIIWLGHSFFKIISPKGKVILIDPWKDFPPGNKLFPKDISVNDADIILITHGHFDHLGDTVELAKASAKPNRKIVSIFEIMIYFLEQGVAQEKLQPVNKGGTVEIDGISVTLVNAVHSSGIGAFAPKNLLNGGEAGGFVIKLENGFTIYHAGDTDVFSDMALLAERFHPDLALLPIGGVFTMGPKDAALAAGMLKPKFVIPMHYAGTFGLPGKPAEFAAAVKRKRGKLTKVIIAQPGQIIQKEIAG